MEKTVTISQKEYEELVRYKKVDKELLEDIALGVKDILAGKLRKI